MKKNLLVLAGLLTAVGAFAQGSIRFEDRVTGTSTAAVVAPIYNVDPANPTATKTGNAQSAPTAPIPVGTQIYGGAPLVGTGFTASIWARLAGTQNAFVQAATTPFRATTSTTLFGFWTTPGTAVVLQGIPSDVASRAEIIIRAWDNKGGTITTWAQAIDPANQDAFGESLAFVAPDQLGGGTTLPPTLVGLQSFQLHTVPEPSVIALGALGAGCLLLLRRRK
jgi:hypothetical protein